MNIDNINLNNLRIFECVYRTRSMTKAAEELHLTQSGVSQHIRALEEVLGVKLFDRVKQRLMTTAEADRLAKHVTEALYLIERTLGEIKKGPSRVAGTISFGMPIEFGNNIVIPKVAEFSQHYPEVRFEIEYGYASAINEEVSKGELDFGFIDAYGVDRRLHVERVYDELLFLCASPTFMKDFPGKESKTYFETLHYVDYDQGDPSLKMWFKHHYHVNPHALQVRGIVRDTQGVTRVVLNSMAAGVLPDHVVTRLETRGQKLHIFEGSGKPLKNSIHLTQLPGKTLPHAASVFLKWLLPKIDN